MGYKSPATMSDMKPSGIVTTPLRPHWEPVGVRKLAIRTWLGASQTQPAIMLENRSSEVPRPSRCQKYLCGILEHSHLLRGLICSLIGQELMTLAHIRQVGGASSPLPPHLGWTVKPYFNPPFAKIWLLTRGGGLRHPHDNCPIIDQFCPIITIIQQILESGFS